MRLGEAVVTSAFAVEGDGAEAALGDLPAEALIEGEALLQVTVADRAGNQAQAVRSFRIDLTPPDLALEPAEGAALERGETLTLRATYGDPVQGQGCGIDLSRFRATLDGEPITSAFMVGATEATATLPAPAAGGHLLEVTVVDLAGNARVGAASLELLEAAGPAGAARFELVIVPRPAEVAPVATPTLLALDTLLGGEARTAIGAGNSLRATSAGRAGGALRRLLAPAYGDGRSSPAGADRPGPREVSNAVHAQPGPRPNRRQATDLFWMFGQFLDHDLSLTEPDAGTPWPIPVPQGDPWFDPLGTGGATIPFFRSGFVAGTGEGPEGTLRQQPNVITAWLDASQVYGSDPTLAATLRTHDGTGRLRLTSEGLLPEDPAHPGTFLAGDGRVNENVALMALHTIFAREHNWHAQSRSRVDSPAPLSPPPTPRLSGVAKRGRRVLSASRSQK